MGMKAHLARELETMLTQNSSASQLGDWLTRNGGIVRDALIISDDIVTIRKIDLSDAIGFPATRPQ